MAKINLQWLSRLNTEELLCLKLISFLGEMFTLQQLSLLIRCVPLVFRGKSMEEIIQLLNSIAKSDVIGVMDGVTAPTTPQNNYN